jgi:HK97 family phage major capsid protein
MNELATDIRRLGAIEGAFTDAQRAEFKAKTDEYDRLAEQEPDFAARAERARLAAPAYSRVASAGVGGAARSAAMYAIERTAQRLGVDERRLESVERFVKGDPTNEAARYASVLADVNYHTAWLKVVRDPARGQAEWTPEEQAAVSRVSAISRAMAESPGSAGGYIVPLYVDPAIVITGTGAAAAIRSVANVKTITTQTYNGATAGQVTASVLAENAAFPDGTPALAQVQIPTYKLGAYVPASFEAYEDIADLAQDVSMLFTDAKANLEASLFVTGTGTAQPKGVLTAVSAVTASRVSPATGGTLAAADIFTVHAALPPRFRESPSARRAWLANVGVIDKVRQFGTSNVYYAFTVNATEGAPAALVGDTLIEASPMSSSITTGQDVLLYGSFDRYYIIDRVGPTVEFIQEAALAA